MTDPRQAFVHEATLRLGEGTDPAAPGAAVTTALCGHSEHEGPCRWPHNNEIQSLDGLAAFRTIFVALPTEQEEIRARIERALRDATEWSVVRAGPRPVAPMERSLAERLANAPQP